jgi:hypothetical protein
MFRTISLWILLPATLFSGAEPTRKPQEYPAHARVGTIIIAAENLGPSVPAPSGGIYLKDYIAIEVAVFSQSALRSTTPLSPSHFGLRINGSRSILRPDSPGFVAAALKYSDWERYRGLEARAGIGDAGVVLGRPTPTARFPGDRRPIEGRAPNPVPRVESPVQQQKEETPIDELVQTAALLEGEPVLPTSGVLYFQYKGKLKKIKKLELVYEGPSGEVSLKIP